MAFITTMGDMRLGRGIKQVYAKTQATPSAGRLKEGIRVFPGLALAGGLDSLIKCDDTMRPIGICGSNTLETVSGDVSIWIPGEDAIIKVSRYDESFDWQSAVEAIVEVEEICLGATEDGLLTIVDFDDDRAGLRFVGFEDGCILVSGLNNANGKEWDYSKRYKVIGRTLYIAKDCATVDDGLLHVLASGLTVE